MKTALLISTYNWPEALELILNSILIQTVTPDVVLIADDGSDERTTELIHKFQAMNNLTINHYWQEDKGFRKSKILNKSIAQSTADYIIQVDGDCILHKNFIKDHINNAETGIYLYGSRVNILPQHVDTVIKNKKIFFSLFSKEIKNKTRTLNIPFLSRLYLPHFGISKKFRGCNVSFWRKDFIAINGYNEAFEGWGREDSDLAIRLGNNGVKGRRLRYCGVVFHIYHHEKSKDNLGINNLIQENTIKNKITGCDKGIQQYL
ncbi:MAG: glycosyltransferase family 2 protein [Flavobacterium sp.]|nr:glycosyltransferase family 2 protein [Flavobacterium sp.]